MSTSLPLTFKRILIGVDDSPQSAWALRTGSQLAEQLSARLLLVHVVEVNVPVDGDIIAMERIEALQLVHGAEMLERASRSIPENVRVECLQFTGIPSEEIAAAAREWQADLVVVGTRDRGRLSHFVLGSTSDALIRQCPCPVISVAHLPKCACREPAGWAGVGADSAGSLSAHVQLAGK